MAVTAGGGADWERTAWASGAALPAVARTCSLIFMVLDVLKPLGHKKILENELEGYGIRLNQKPPRITFRKKEKGGLSISSTVRARGAAGRKKMDAAPDAVGRAAMSLRAPVGAADQDRHGGGEGGLLRVQDPQLRHHLPRGLHDRPADRRYRRQPVRAASPAHAMRMGRNP